MPIIPQSDVLVVSSHPPEWGELVKYTCESHAAYCRARGYDYHVDCSSLVDGRKGNIMPIRGFIKFDLLLHFLPHYRFVVWLDADLIVTNREFDMRKLFFLRSQRIVVGYDWNSFNSTVIAVHSSHEARSYLWACNNTGRDLFLDHGWHEMQAMKYFSQFPPYNALIDYRSCKELAAILPEEYEPHGVPREVMMPYAWEPGDFACHLSALTLPRRVELARQITERMNAGV